MFNLIETPAPGFIKPITTEGDAVLIRAAAIISIQRADRASETAIKVTDGTHFYVRATVAELETALTGAQPGSKAENGSAHRAAPRTNLRSIAVPSA
jgi:hypothetical protein